MINVWNLGELVYEEIIDDSRYALDYMPVE